MIIYTLKATIFIINIPILSPKSHLLLLYHQICVLNLPGGKNYYYWYNSIFFIIYANYLQSHTSCPVSSDLCAQSAAEEVATQFVCSLGRPPLYTHCTKINKNLKYNRLLGRAEIHTIQISFVVFCWVVFKHETAPLLDAGATK